MPTKCLIIKCSRPAIAKGLCDTHRKRVERRGTADDLRPKDYGSREKHPLYPIWSYLRRAHLKDLCPEWLDLWGFIRDVKKRGPEGSVFTRSDETLPYAPGNWYWRVPQGSGRTEKEKAGWAAYIRSRRHALEKANPRYFKDQYLKRRYGVEKGWFETQFTKQEGLCKICRQPETKVDPQRNTVRDLSVDHCHETGTVRGLLCSDCNTAIGLFKHSRPLLQAAIKYLG